MNQWRNRWMHNSYDCSPKAGRSARKTSSCVASDFLPGILLVDAEMTFSWDGSWENRMTIIFRLIEKAFSCDRSWKILNWSSYSRQFAIPPKKTLNQKNKQTNKQTNEPTKKTNKQTNKQTKKIQTRLCSENKPLGNPSGCLAAKMCNIKTS